MDVSHPDHADHPDHAEPRLNLSDGLPSDQADVLATLRRIWGYAQLRPLQREAIAASMAGRDSLLVMPTGGGKSLTYQLPAILGQRIDVVVSPLIALMKDQVDGLRADGVEAIAWHGNLSGGERDAIRSDLLAGRYRLLYLSPEMLMGGSLHGLLRDLDVRCFTIDEAHCISQWGHDFRPEYRMLAALRDTFPKASLHACTATATPRVREDIVRQLRLRNPDVLIGSFDRPNLTYRILRREQRQQQIFHEIQRHRGEGVIVYALTRKDTETIADQLIRKGVLAACYHAGLAPRERSRVQEQFTREAIDVVVATVAFGMGIDRSNIRAVIHAAMPKSIEAYQQETGRAGRDGEPADCVLLYAYADVERWRQLSANSFAEAMAVSDDPELLQQEFDAQMGLLQAMSGLCTTARCRHRVLVEYFGQSWDHPPCGACDVCLDEIAVMPESMVVAQKIISCVARLDAMGHHFGVQHVADVLCGAQLDAVKRWGHDHISTFGLLNALPRRTVAQLLFQLIEQDLLARTPGDRPVVTLSELSAPVLRGEVEVKLIQPTPQGPRRASVAETAAAQGVDAGLFEVLRALRRTIAQEIDKPAYVVFSDATLRALARSRPATLEEMIEVKGVGEVKLKRHGERFLATIRANAGLSEDEG